MRPGRDPGLWAPEPSIPDQRNRHCSFQLIGLGAAVDSCRGPPSYLPATRLHERLDQSLKDDLTVRTSSHPLRLFVYLGRQSCVITEESLIAPGVAALDRRMHVRVPRVAVPLRGPAFRARRTKHLLSKLGASAPSSAASSASAKVPGAIEAEAGRSDSWELHSSTCRASIPESLSHPTPS